MKGKKCRFCGNSSPDISSYLEVCVNCIRDNSEKVLPHLIEKHKIVRREFNMVETPPRGDGGIVCPFCVNRCVLGEGEIGYCGMKKNLEGKLVDVLERREYGLMHYYFDPLPTNCVADWVCEGHYKTGYYNLAIFYGSCNFNCLFCQNWHYRSLYLKRRYIVEVEELLKETHIRTFCVCFFGGDPSSQILNSLEISKRFLERGLRICFETNGSVNPKIMERIVDIALESGGVIKIDLKAITESLHRALTGSSNTWTLENIRRMAKRFEERKNPPLLVVSTLLVTGYVDEKEVSKIAEFLVNLNPEIPLALLGFHPQFYMHDLSPTSRKLAENCRDIALKKGLKNVRIGNYHILV